MKSILGRDKEKAKLKGVVSSRKSEFVAVYGRRRVGKTFLIREYFDNNFTFHVTGVNNASLNQQLYNFHVAVLKISGKTHFEQPKKWLQAFNQLIDCLKKLTVKRKIIFIDELPWLDSPKSKFLSALEHFWNHWASARKDIVLIVCGSAASWMLNKIVKNTGGLHNRLTERIKVEPFTIKETELFLKHKKIVLNRYQICELYMILGGIPYYLEGIKKGKSVAQNIDDMCFEKNGLLHEEFKNLYASLFKNHENYVRVIAALSKKNKGLTRDAILDETNMKDGGTFSKILEDLEESGFIRKYDYFGQTKKDALYQLIDFYSLFYFNFLKNNKQNNYWVTTIDHPKRRSWSGYAFELLCLLHEEQIKKALGISGVLTDLSSWVSRRKESNVQIDLLFDRRDQVITLCEIKYSLNKFSIDKKYAVNLRNKIGIFRSETNTKKAVHLAMITTYGTEENEQYYDLVQNTVVMNDLFD
jgi:uncharacterized protein